MFCKVFESYLNIHKGLTNTSQYIICFLNCFYTLLSWSHIFTSLLSLIHITHHFYSASVFLLSLTHTAHHFLSSFLTDKICQHYNISGTVYHNRSSPSVHHLPTLVTPGSSRPSPCSRKRHAPARCPPLAPLPVKQTKGLTRSFSLQE